MKKLSLLLAVILLIAALSACSNSEPQTGSPDPGPASDNSPAQSLDDDEDDLKDIVELNMLFLSSSGIPTGLQAVEDAINEITEKEINAHVNIEILDIGSYIQNVSLAITSGETIDLMVTFPADSAHFSVMSSQNQLMAINEYLDEYGQGILDLVGDYISATTIEGNIYGVPTYRMLNTGAYISMRTDVLEDLGLLEDARNIKSFDDYEAILEAVANSEKWSYLSPMVGNSTGNVIHLSGTGLLLDNDFDDIVSIDLLGDGLGLTSVRSGSSTVENYYKTDEYQWALEKVQDWYAKGYVYKDTATMSESGNTVVKSNAAFSMIVAAEADAETSQASVCGMPMTCVEIIQTTIDTSSCTKFVWSVPITAKEPEAAVQFMNMMYTDERIANLLTWGVEGRDYQVVDGEATFVDGQDTETTPYQMNDYLFGNQYLAHPWEGQGADFRTTSEATMKTSAVSDFLGFSFDNSDLQTEIAAITNTINEYRPALQSGVGDEAMYIEFLEKLDASGAQKVIDECQRQLDEWIAAQ